MHYCGEVVNNAASMRRFTRRLREDWGPVLHFVYEAGPCGYTLLRRLREWGYVYDLIAQSRIPKQAADRIKTDRRDAPELARLDAMGYLEPLCIPYPAEEAMRDLVRLRMDLKFAKLLIHEIVHAAAYYTEADADLCSEEITKEVFGDDNTAQRIYELAGIDCTRSSYEHN